MNKWALSFLCFVNRNLRYGPSAGKLEQYVVIKTRSFAKRAIDRNTAQIDQLGSREISLKYAGRMSLSTNDYIDRWLYTGGDFEPHIVELVRNLLREGDCFLDLGTNIGYFTLIASRKVGANGKVYSFEPTPKTISKLKRNIELNRAANISLFEKAVSNKPGTVSFKVPSGNIKNSGRASFRHLEGDFDEISVETVVLDDMLPGIEPIRLIKMDIEGAEGYALEGMSALLERDSPYIIMELSDSYLKQLGSSADQVVQFLRARNYVIYVVTDTARLLKDTGTLTDHQYDILCAPMAQQAEAEALLQKLYGGIQ